MKVTVERTTATEVHIADYRSVTVVGPAAVTPRRKPRPVRRSRGTPHRTRVAADGMVEVTLEVKADAASGDYDIKLEKLGS